MMGGFRGWLTVSASGGILSAAVFAMTADPLEPLGVVRFSFWITAIVILVCGVLGSLVLVDLKRTFLAAPGTAVLAALFYGFTLWSPAVQMGHYSNHLLNYALVQAVPVFIITLILITLGAMAGTAVNASVREFDL